MFYTTIKISGLSSTICGPRKVLSNVGFGLTTLNIVEGGKVTNECL